MAPIIGTIQTGLEKIDGFDQPFRKSRFNFSRLQTSNSKLGIKCVLIFLGVAMLYWRTHSKWLDDWDSVQFALGVKDFNLFLHQPHPPGYPLYIFLGWLGVHGPGMTIPGALTLVGCLSAGLFVTVWFYIMVQRFREGLGWLMVLTLTFIPMDWMTGTKALTDMPAAAFLALELALIAPWPWREFTTRRIILAALVGAIATGVRPQNTIVAPLILMTGLWRARAGWRYWGIAGGVFVAGYLAWLIPTLWTQAALPDAQGNWLAYPRQVLAQWRWRLDKPDVYLGAGEWSISYIGRRIYRHTLKAWLLLGFGWHPRQFLGALGLTLYGGGMLIYFWKKVYREQDQCDFWRVNCLWAPIYIFSIFAALPPDTRYYCPIAPLLVLPPLAGWWSLRGRWRWTAAAIPFLLLITTWPLAALNHRKAPPPVRMLDYLKKNVPPKKQRKTWLFLTDSRRHASWYAPDFKLASVKKAQSEEKRILSEAYAIYTEDPHFIVKSHWQGVTLRKVRVFKRSPVIHAKHAKCRLYKIVPMDGRHPIEP